MIKVVETKHAGMYTRGSYTQTCEGVVPCDSCTVCRRNSLLFGGMRTRLR